MLFTPTLKVAWSEPVQHVLYIYAFSRTVQSVDYQVEQERFFYNKWAWQDHSAIIIVFAIEFII